MTCTRRSPILSSMTREEVAEHDLLRVVLVAARSCGRRGRACARPSRWSARRRSRSSGSGRREGTSRRTASAAGRAGVPAARVGDGLLIADPRRGHPSTPLPPPRGTHRPRRPRPATISGGSPCCPGTPRSASWRRRRSGAVELQGQVRLARGVADVVLDVRVGTALEVGDVDQVQVLAVAHECRGMQELRP